MYDSNRNSEPIHLDPPKISPIASFGIAGRTQISIVPPNPSPSSALRTIGSVTANTRDYRVDLIGAETLLGTSTFHLKLTPLHDPKIYRLRDLWVDPQTFRTVELRVQGLLHGEPYDRVEWTVRYVELRGRNYVQQITADGPLRFGLNTVIPTFEFDFVDYHYPSEVPKYTFDRPF
jgi:hypothetical protein